MANFRIHNSIVAASDRLINRYAITPEQADETPYISYLGTPVFSPLEFLKVSGTSMEVKGDVMLRIDTVIMTVTQTKNLVKTPIPGRDGEVIEYIGKGNYAIDIKGELVSPQANVFPEDDVQMLLELMDLKKQLPVASEWLNRFNIDAIVIESFTLSQKLGSRNSVPFEIQAISDLAEEIVLNPNKI